MLAASEVEVEVEVELVELAVTFGLCSTIVSASNNSAFSELGTALGTELGTCVATCVFATASLRAVLSTVLLSTHSISPSKKSKSLISILDTFLPS